MFRRRFAPLLLPSCLLLFAVLLVDIAHGEYKEPELMNESELENIMQYCQHHKSSKTSAELDQEKRKMKTKIMNKIKQGKQVGGGGKKPAAAANEPPKPTSQQLLDHCCADLKKLSVDEDNKKQTADKILASEKSKYQKRMSQYQNGQKPTPADKKKAMTDPPKASLMPCLALECTKKDGKMVCEVSKAKQQQMKKQMAQHFANKQQMRGGGGGGQGSGKSGVAHAKDTAKHAVSGVKDKVLHRSKSVGAQPDAGSKPVSKL